MLFQPPDGDTKPEVVPCDTVPAEVEVSLAVDVAPTVLEEFPTTTTTYERVVVLLLEDVVLFDALTSEPDVTELISDVEELSDVIVPNSELVDVVELSVSEEGDPVPDTEDVFHDPDRRSS